MLNLQMLQNGEEQEITAEGIIKIQDDLGRLENLAKTFKINVNRDTGKLLHLKRKKSNTYLQDGEELSWQWHVKKGSRGS